MTIWWLTCEPCPRRSRSIRPAHRALKAFGRAAGYSPTWAAPIATSPTLGNVRGIYSDLLLHDMGQSLSDSGSYYGSEGPSSPGAASPQEWRTPPLWGYRDSGPYLHDGRADDLEEAVALHGGQALASTRRFFALTAEDRFHVEAFLKSLVAPLATAAPGVMLAAEMESRFEQEEEGTPESLVRRRWAETVARGDWQRREDQRRQREEEAARRAHTRCKSLGPWRRRARLPARWSSTARSLARPPTRTRAEWPPREWPHSAGHVIFSRVCPIQSHR